MEIKRDRYLNKLISFMWDGQVKVITGIRRCGKSYLLRNLFRDYLLGQGVQEDHILSFELDLARDIRFRNPLELAKAVRELVEGKDEQFYLFVDEIQMSDEVANPYNADGRKITFYDALNDLKSISNLDIYVTGSNSKMLSSDILTEFRGRSDEIRVHPLSFAEYYSAAGGDKSDAFDAYAFFGGMPLILSRPTDSAKMTYLTSLFSEVYLKDIVERKHIQREDVLSSILDLLCSSIGSLTNPTRVADTINTKQKRAGENVVALNTVKSYMDHLSDAFLFTECKRWDVKGKSYFDYPNKYYCEDIGLRNARIGFRQQEMTHIMENIIFNELMIRDCAVDIGIVYSAEKNSQGKVSQVAREIDFIANSGGKKTYIQSAYALGTEEKAITENKPFALTGDSFPKIIVRHDIRKRWYDDNGILNIGIIDFLLDNTVI
ncbi:MAG TPA: ATP-binding protein [Oscillospiraceae bacterium]|nr:ATP-binding protein [Oscillospiraceae bacterium]HPK35235.1 ATP-binding protein [Oscillospiraceae bacterium]HPR75428.1 ATP-binding protein [Oscillospiraceae bacterium]